MPVSVEYGIDKDCNVLFIESIKADSFELIGYFEPPQISSIEGQLWKLHDNVVREMNLQARADRAADNAAFREVYA